MQTNRWASRLGMAMVATVMCTLVANAQTNVAGRYNNPAAQGYASDGGCCNVASPNGPLDGDRDPSYDPSTYWHSGAAQGAWWYVDMAQDWSISSMVFYNRYTDCCNYRSVNALFQLWTAAPDFVSGTAAFTATLDGSAIQSFAVPDITARYASVRAGNCGAGDCYLNFPEVEVYGVAVNATPEPASLVLLATGLFAVGAVVRRKRAA